MNNFNIFDSSGLLYVFSNVAVLLIIIIIFWISSFIQKNQLKNLSNQTISIVAVLLSFSVVINTLIGQLSFLSWKIPGFYRFRIEFKGIMLFIIGMIYGPFFGFMAGFCNDIIGLVVKVRGVFHLGFTLCDILYGFVGSLVFLFNKKKRWYFKTILIFSFFLIFHTLLLEPLFLYCSGWSLILIIKGFITRLIKLPLILVSYNLLVILLFKTLYKIILIRCHQDVWMLRYGKITIEFKLKQIN